MDFTWRVFSGEGGGRNKWGKVQGRRSITSRHKIDGEKLKMIWETENSKNLYVQPVDMNQGRGDAGRWGGRLEAE